MPAVPAKPGLRARLGLKLLWLRHAYSFLWAHHPLCERFREDVFQIGRVHLCRSCAAAYLGMATGVILLATTSLLSTPTLPMVLAIPTVVLSHPRFYKRMPRLLRDLLRTSMGLLIVACGGLFLSGCYFTGAVLSVVLFAFWRFYFRLRHARRLAACNGCPELNGDGVCSGFARQAESVRTYERKATEMLYRSTPLPSRRNRLPARMLLRGCRRSR